MKKIIYMLMALILVSGVNGLSRMCYQETANDSSVTSTNPTLADGDCNLQYTGSYYCFGNWDASGPCYRNYDGDWDTWSSGADDTAKIYINYTKPSLALSSSKWQVKYDDFVVAGEFTENLTIPSECWEQSILQFRINSSGTMEVGEFYCLNNTGWAKLATTYSPVIYVIYEESMWWNISIERPYRFGLIGYLPSSICTERPCRFGFNGNLPPQACTKRPCRYGIRGYVDEKTFT